MGMGMGMGMGIGMMKHRRAEGTLMDLASFSSSSHCRGEDIAAQFTTRSIPSASAMHASTQGHVKRPPRRFAAAQGAQSGGT